MDTSGQALGYQCEFIASVFEDFFCTSCKFVARKPTITDCCGETYCHDCIAETQEQSKPCPACGEKDFSLTKHIKYQKKINKLQVYCSMKERGCDWSGPLEQLETHLDPDQDNCQYVDIKCPLKCRVAIPKNKVEQHVTEECAKRPYVCQYCNFKATYEEVKDKHMPECKYVPLQCPNLCGVTFERDFMEDHMKMCHLEEVKCKFSGVGCFDRFKREDQAEHARQNSQKHLNLTASLSVETREQLQDQNKYLKEKLKEQDQKLEKLAQILLEHNKKQDQKLKEQDNLIKDQALKLKEQDEKLKMQDQKLEEFGQSQLKLQELEGKYQMLLQADPKLNAVVTRTFTMENFSEQKRRQSLWNSPAMYTHVGGYKFCLYIYANGHGVWHGKAIAIQLSSQPGEYDDQLKWPVKIEIILELVNQCGGENVIAACTDTFTKKLAGKGYMVEDIGSHFVDHSQLRDFLVDDKLRFLVSKVEFS